MTGDSLVTRGDTPRNLWHNNPIAGTLPARRAVMNNSAIKAEIANYEDQRWQLVLEIVKIKKELATKEQELVDLVSVIEYLTERVIA